MVYRDPLAGAVGAGQDVKNPKLQDEGWYTLLTVHNNAVPLEQDVLEEQSPLLIDKVCFVGVKL